MMKKLLLLIVCCVSYFMVHANLMAGWDGNGDTGTTTSFPNRYGWSVNPGEFTYANNSAGGLRWMDVTGTTHQLNGSAYAGRLMLVRWDGAGATSSSSVFAFQVTLEANKRYLFSFIYEWWNNASAPVLTMGLSKDNLATESLITKKFQCSSTKNLLLEGDMGFFVREAGTYYITIQGDGLATLCAVGNLSLVEDTPVLECNTSSIELTYFQSEVEIDIYPNGSNDPVTITAPANVNLSVSTLPSVGGIVTVSTKDSTDISNENIIISQGSDQITIPIKGIFPPDFNPSHISTVTAEGAWCWFADPRALYYENEAGTIKNTYIGYIDVHGAIKATQIDHINNVSSEVLIRSYFQPDDHNNPTFLALPDGRIMIFYSRHTDEACFYYRVSQKPGDITTLGAEVRLVTANNTTYPSPFILSDDPNHIYLCWRGINWHPTVGRMPIPTPGNDEVNFNWGPYQIVQSTAARPYAKYASNGKDKLYMTYTTGHPDNEATNYVYFNYIDINDKGLKDIKGKTLSTVGSAVHNIAATSTYYNTNPDAVVENSSYRNWVWQVSMDGGGNPVIAMVRIDANKDVHDYYYAKWTGTTWRKTFLENGGGQFHQTPGLEKCYSGGMAIDNENPNVMYCAVPVIGRYGKVYEIKKYTVGADGSVESIVQLTGNSTKNNVRPYVISGDKNMITWMHGDYYDWIVSRDRPLGYPTGIQANFEVPQAAVNLNSGLLKHEEFNDLSGITGDATVAAGVLLLNSASQRATIEASASNTFTVALSPYVDNASYSGQIVKIGDIVYGLKDGVYPKRQITYTIIGNEIYESSNVLGSSDVWKTLARGTGGNWDAPTKFKFFSLVLTYENGVLKTYINGLLDQYIEAAGLTLNDVVIGGFKGNVEDCRIYNRVLTQEEIKTISDALATAVADKEEEIEFNLISVPQDIYTDIVMQTALSTGSTVTWTSSEPAVISTTGLVTLPAQSTNLTLTATVAGFEPRIFNVTVHARDIEQNKLIWYQFEAADLYTDNGVKYVADKSGNGNDAVIYGSAQVNGTLNLSANTATGFSTNGYALAPSGMLTDLRSYSFVMKVKPSNLDKAPRIFDFGSGSGNSVFGRLNAFSAGVKYNGETTVLVNSSTPLTVGNEVQLAFTFDAKTQTTKIFVDGSEKADGITIKKEPYELALIGADARNYIGRTQWWDTSEANNNADYCGTVDDFYLFNIALTANEIKNLASSLVSVPQLTSNSSLVVYPNPVSQGENIYVQCDFNTAEKENLKVEIFNIQGQLVKIINPTDYPISFSNTMESGLYLIRITTGTNEILRSKFLSK